MRILRKSAAALRAAPLLLRLSRGQDRPADDATHIEAAVRWLLAAQEAAGGGGFAHSFHLAHGWQPAYPETTGYILSSLLAVKAVREDLAPVLAASIARGARWLVSVQHADGAIPDVAGTKQVFDTGQVLGGYVDLHRAEPELIDAARIRRTAAWLASVQETDGRFQRFAFLERPRSYYARVGAALIRAGQLLDEPEFVAAGCANLDWTLRQQRPNGFFDRLSFAEEPPYLHTMCYVAEGLLDGADAAGRPDYAAAALRFCRQVLDAAGTGVPISQYDPSFAPTNRQYCLTGVAQWAALALRLGRAHGDARFLASASAALALLRRRQILGTGDSRLDGGLCGSDPPWGTYLWLAIPNWAVKFLIDAFLAAGPAGAEGAACAT